MLAALSLPDWMRERSTLLDMVETGGPMEVVAGASKHVVDSRLFGLVILLIPIVLAASACIFFASALKEGKEATQPREPTR